MIISMATHAANGILSFFYARVLCVPQLRCLFLCRGHLGWFHVWAVVNSAAENTGVCVSFEASFSPDTCPGVGLLDHMVAVFLVFY